MKPLDKLLTEILTAYIYTIISCWRAEEVCEYLGDTANCAIARPTKKSCLVYAAGHSVIAEVRLSFYLMPLSLTNYYPRWPLTSGHFQSIVPATLFRFPPPERVFESLETPDGDVLNLAWELSPGSNHLVILSHGLEGSISSTYILGTTRTLLQHGYSVLMWNMRGCGGTPNRLLRWYHSGESGDLRLIINRALQSPWPTQSNHNHLSLQSSLEKPIQISLIGFSIGGNITLKYLGEEGSTISGEIKSAVTISVPVELNSSAEQLARPSNRLYMKHLLAPLKRRMREKATAFPGKVQIDGLEKIKTFHEFDRRYTAPFHGFESVKQYWDLSSSKQFLSSIKIPTLLLNALDDPFLGKDCFPTVEAEASNFVYLETPRYGGHVGFMTGLMTSKRWSEERAVDFLRRHE